MGYSRRETALELSGSLIPIRPLRPCRKLPWAGPDGKVLTLERPDAVNAFWQKHPEANVGACLSPIAHSPIVVVDIDICDVPEADRNKVRALLGEMGVTLRDSVWAQRTGRGNYQVFYWAPDWEIDIPTRHVNAGGLHVDLLSNGYVVTAPSDTGKEPPKRPGATGGGPYRWIEGHSPWDLSLSAVSKPPAALIAWWREQVQRDGPAPDPSIPDQRGEPATVGDLLGGPLIGQYRNVNLTRIAGRLATHHDGLTLAALLHGINQTRCRPPLPVQEVDAIARSIASREGRKPSLALGGHGDELHLIR